MTASGKIVSGVRTFAADVTEGFLEITHNSFALIGLAVAFIIIALTARPDLRRPVVIEGEYRDTTRPPPSLPPGA